MEIKEIQVGYLYSPYFKDLYLYLSQNKFPSSKSAIRKLETLSEKYVLLDSPLFKISPEQETVNPSHASKQKIDKRQKGHDRFQTSKLENSQKQFGLLFVEGHVHLAW